MKWPIVASIVWLLVVIAAGIALLWYAWENRVWPRNSFNERSGALGSAFGVIAAIGLAAIWGIWYYREKNG
jgi:hypothetical protein